MPPNQLKVSLYKTLLDALGQAARVGRYSKSTLIHISHSLEDLVLQHRVPALIFTAFQQASYWQDETPRYLALAEVARQVTIFAGSALPPERYAEVAAVELAEDDPLRGEWLVLVFSEQFSALLSGLDQSQAGDEDEQREFDTLLTFDPVMLNTALDVLETVLETYAPGQLAVLRAARAEFNLARPNLRLLTEFTAEIIRYEEQLQRALRETNRQLQMTNERLQTEQAFRIKLMETSAAFFLALNADGQILLMNQTMLNALGYTLDEVLFKPYQEMFKSPEIQDLLNPMSESARGIVRILKKTGEEVVVEWHVRPILNERGELDLLFCVGLDITESKKLAQKTLEFAIEQERMKVLVDFFRNASHDFRTPLATINTSLYLLERAQTPEQRERSIRNLQEQAEHLERLVDELFTMASLDSDDTLHLVDVDVSELLDDLLVSRQTEPSKPDVTLKLETLPNLPMIQVDRVAMHRALGNILDNAITYSRAGQTVEIRALRQTPDLLAIEIIDQGIGISADDLPLIFDRFFRADRARAVETGGLGLGLPIARKIIERHRGRIEVVSQQDEGSTFRVLLPIAAQDMAGD